MSKENAGPAHDLPCWPLEDGNSAEAVAQATRLHDTTDGQVWAQEFNKVFARLYKDTLDEGWLIGWFANAIETGRSAGLRQSLSQEAVRDEVLEEAAKVCEKRAQALSEDPNNGYVEGDTNAFIWTNLEAGYVAEELDETAKTIRALKREPNAAGEAGQNKFRTASSIEVNSPFERIPQHAGDPGFGPVPPESSVRNLVDVPMEGHAAGPAPAAPDVLGEQPTHFEMARTRMLRKRIADIVATHDAFVADHTNRERAEALRHAIDKARGIGLTKAEQEKQTDYDCPHAYPHRYCETCKVDPCPLGLGKKSPPAPGASDD